MLLEVLSDEQKQILESQGQIDLMYSLPGVGRFRGNIFAQAKGWSAVFRVVPAAPPRVTDLNLFPSIAGLAQLQNGLVIVTGPTGSGKSTTLAALVREINESSHRHIITIEDPIEYVHTSIKSRVTQRQVGQHVETFAQGLRSSLRESPDVLVIGEMRDAETVQLALSAAETGVLVFGTLHTNSAARAIDRILDTLPEETREHARGVLSVLLRGVVSQRLLKNARGEGRFAITEVLIGSTAIASMIRESKTHLIDGALQSANDPRGLMGFDNALVRAVASRMVSPDDAILHARQGEALRKRLAEVTADA